MLAKVGSAQAKMPEHERVRAGQSGRHHPGHVRVGDEGALDDRVVAARGPHAERVPRLDDAVALGLAGQEGVDDLGVRRVSWCPWRGGRAGSTPGSGSRRSCGRRSGSRRRLGSAWAVESSTGKSLPASPWPAANTSPATASSSSQLRDLSPLAPEVGGQARPVHVHVEGQGRRRGAVGQAALFLADLGQAHAQAAQLGRHGHQQIAGLRAVPRSLR